MVNLKTECIQVNYPQLRKHSIRTLFKLRSGMLVGHVRYEPCYVDYNLRGKFSSHRLRTRKKLARKREEFKVLTRIVFEIQFLSLINRSSG